MTCIEYGLHFTILSRLNLNILLISSLYPSTWPLGLTLCQHSCILYNSINVYCNTCILRTARINVILRGCTDHHLSSRLPLTVPPVSDTITPCLSLCQPRQEHSGKTKWCLTLGVIISVFIMGRLTHYGAVFSQLGGHPSTFM